MQHKVQRKVAKSKQKACDELYERYDTEEGEKYIVCRGRGKDVRQVRMIKDEDRNALTSEESGLRGWNE